MTTPQIVQDTNGYRLYKVEDPTNYIVEMSKGAEIIKITGIKDTFKYLPTIKYSQQNPFIELYNDIIGKKTEFILDFDDQMIKNDTVTNFKLPNTNYVMFFAVKSSYVFAKQQMLQSNMFTICFGIVDEFIYRPMHQNNNNAISATNNVIDQRVPISRIQYTTDIIDVLYKQFRENPVSIMSFDILDAKVMMKLVI